MPGIATIPAYFKAGHMGQFLGFVLSIVIAFVLGTVLTWIVGFEEKKEEIVELEKETEIESKNADEKTAKSIEIASPVKGDIIPVTEVKDEVFASKGLGDGVGIISAEGKVYAPYDGTVEVLFPTGHAIGLSGDGIETLIHIGIDTVELNGEGFQPKVEQGDTVKKGDLLVEFDKEFIVEKGYDSTVIFIVTEMSDDQKLEIYPGKDKDALETVMCVKCQEGL